MLLVTHTRGRADREEALVEIGMRGAPWRRQALGKGGGRREAAFDGQERQSRAAGKKRLPASTVGGGREELATGACAAMSGAMWL